jgi:glycosyltransferase involved in cell wall biosynthesis
VAGSSLGKFESIRAGEPAAADALRILIVSPYPLDPPLHGGRVRALGMARGLARAGAIVDILAPWVPGTVRQRLLEPRLTIRTHQMIGNALPLLFSDRLVPALALLSLYPRWAGPRRLLVGFTGYDIVQFEFCAQFHWSGLVPGNPHIAYSAHNVELDYHAEQPGLRFTRKSVLRQIERCERAAVRLSDIVITCSEGDSDRLSFVYGEPHRTVVIANGFDGALLDFQRSQLRELARSSLGLSPADRVILFVGGAAAHNHDAVRFLARDVLPSLPGSTRLVIAGHAGAAAPRGHPQIRALGFVEDLRMCFAAADVAVNPVSFGSGTNVKLAEYLAAGVPTISTPTGLRGAAHLADAIRCVPREEFAAALGASPRELVCDRATFAKWTWDALGCRLLDSYRSLLARMGPKKSPPGV